MNNLQAVSVIVVIRCTNKFLLVKRSGKDETFPGKWQNLGGKVEVGERVEEAIKREAKEEVGLTLTGYPFFVQSYSWDKGDNSERRLGLVFLLNIKGKPNDYKIRLCEELSDYEWVTLKEARLLNNRDLLIAKESPTGTFSQIIQADKILKDGLFRPRSGD